jgi:hypothetical protein
MLLGAVMEVALEAASLCVLGRDKALARSLDLLGADQQFGATVIKLSLKPDPPQNQTGLGSEPGEQPFLHEGESQTGALLKPEHAQQLAAMADRQDPQAVVAHNDSRRLEQRWS